MMNQDQLISRLLSMNFQLQSTVSKKWRMALLFWNGSKTLAILVRKFGIDILETPAHPSALRNEKGLLSVRTALEGHRFGEYNYAKSGLHVHELILNIGTLFASGHALDQRHFKRIGISSLQRKQSTELRYENCTFESSLENLDDPMDSYDLYDAVCVEDGQDAYLSDGVWLTPRGRVYSTR